MVKRTFGVLMTALAIAAVSGCGGPSEDQKVAASDAREKADRAEGLANMAEKKAATAKAAFAECSAQMGGFIDALASLDSRLSVGLLFADYSEEIGNVQVQYDRVPFANIGIACYPVGINGEKALNNYVDAYNTWNDCFSDLYCSDSSIEGELQSDWAKASTKVARARGSLSSLRTDVNIAESESEEAQDAAETSEEAALEAEAVLDA